MTRIEILFRKHNDWLMQVAMNLTKNKMESENLVQNLYLYLLEKDNPKLYFLDSYNLKYCYMFIKSRYTNNVIYNNRFADISEDYDKLDEEYNIEDDLHFTDTYNQVMNVIEDMKLTKNWSAAMMFEMKYKEKLNLKQLSKKLNISYSSSYNHIRTARETIKQKVNKY